MRHNHEPWKLPQYDVLDIWSHYCSKPPRVIGIREKQVYIQRNQCIEEKQKYHHEGKDNLLLVYAGRIQPDEFLLQFYSFIPAIKHNKDYQKIDNKKYYEFD